MFTHYLFTLSAGSLAILVLAGCIQRTPSVALPSYSADKISSAAIVALDTNHDNMLDAEELEKAPGLKAALKNIDEDKDGRISAAEIESRIDAYAKAKVGLRNETYSFTLNGEPLADAHIVFTPEPFFGDSIRQGEGRTDKTGSTALKIEGNSILGMTCGMYQISVSKKNASGKETIPAKYNTETTLGYEFPPKEFSSDAPRTFKLTTK